MGAALRLGFESPAIGRRSSNVFVCFVCFVILCHLTSEPRNWKVLGQSAMVVQRCAEAWQPRCDQLANTIQCLVARPVQRNPRLVNSFESGLRE